MHSDGLKRLLGSMTARPELGHAMTMHVWLSCLSSQKYSHVVHVISCRAPPCVSEISVFSECSVVSVLPACFSISVGHHD